MEGGTFTSDEVNYLIYKYMLENGYHHTAFTFGCESNIINSSIDGTMVPRGALISIIQKGLHFTEAEFFAALSSSVGEDGDARLFESNLGTMSLLEAVMPDTERMKILEKKVVEELGEEACSRAPPNLSIVEPTRLSFAVSESSSQSSSDVESMEGVEDENDENRAETQPSTSAAAGSKEPSPLEGRTHPADTKPAKPPDAGSYGGSASGLINSVGNGLHYQQTSSSSETNGASYQPDALLPDGTRNNNVHGGKLKVAVAAAAAASTRPGSISSNPDINGDPTGRVPLVPMDGKMLPNAKGFDVKLELDRRNVVGLKGHHSDVFVCSWNPHIDIIASGSGDGTARIWDLPPDSFQRGPFYIHDRSAVLDHSTGKPAGQGDVTCINWSADGEYLATGCYDGIARVWSRHGTLHRQIQSHRGPIFALKWSREGSKLLTAGVDNTTSVWDPINGDNGTEKFAFHTNSVLDVDWIDEKTFATCSVDKNIHVCRMGHTVPLKTFKGHEHEVNAVKYDRLSCRLASCSDDTTLKIWSLQEDAPVFNFAAHSQEIHTIRWSPQGNYIASASFDRLVKLWDAKRGGCTGVFEKHTEPVYTVSFSPDGRYLASGSFDQTIVIWDLNSGKPVMTFTGTHLRGGIFEVDWNKRGDLIAASAGGGALLVLDVRFLRQ